MNPCHTWKLCCSPLKIFVELVDFQNKLPCFPLEKESQPNRKSTSQKEVNNKIHTASVDPFCNAFPNSDSHEILTPGRTAYHETPRKISSRSNSRIENYDYWRKTRQLHFLRQNPNLTLPGSYQVYSFQPNLNCSKILPIAPDMSQTVHKSLD